MSSMLKPRQIGTTYFVPNVDLLVNQAEVNIGTTLWVWSDGGDCAESVSLEAQRLTPEGQVEYFFGGYNITEQGKVYAKANNICYNPASNHKLSIWVKWKLDGDMVRKIWHPQAHCSIAYERITKLEFPFTASQYVERIRQLEVTKA